MKDQKTSSWTYKKGEVYRLNNDNKIMIVIIKNQIDGKIYYIHTSYYKDEKSLNYYEDVSTVEVFSSMINCFEYDSILSDKDFARILLCK